jgi:thioredoxin 1
MSRRQATNVVVLIAVVATVVGIAWFKSEHRETPDPINATAGEPAAREEADASPTTSAPNKPLVDTGTTPNAVATAATRPATAELPRLVDLGADKCKACKALAPILEELRKEYKGRLTVEFIDAWKNPDAGGLYGIRLIPTQILYDKTGREVWRHEGFISKKDLKALFAEKVGIK